MANGGVSCWKSMEIWGESIWCLLPSVAFDGRDEAGGQAQENDT